MMTAARRTIALAAAFVLAATLWAPSASAAAPYSPVGSTLVDARTGDEGAHVAALQAMLRRLKMYRGEVNGRFGVETQVAVMTFHKYFRLDRSWEFEARDWWHALEMSDDHGIPDRPSEPDRVEIDIGRQLLFIVRDHEVTDISAISSGGSYTYWSERNQADVRAATPRGDFPLLWFGSGWREDTTTGWWVYNYWAFTPYYGLHGYRTVPAYPASHGCVRVTTWDADWLAPRLAVGLMIHIWDQP